MTKSSRESVQKDVKDIGRISAGTETKITICSMKLGSSDNHYITLPKILLKAISTTQIVRAVLLSLQQCFFIC